MMKIPLNDSAESNKKVSKGEMAGDQRQQCGTHPAVTVHVSTIC